MSKSTLRCLFLFLLCSCTYIAKGQLAASFTADDTAGCASLPVHFTNTSTGATHYSWDLGNGTPPVLSTDASSLYLTPGTYTVTLTAYNGGSSTTSSMVIRAYAAPTVNFTGAPLNVCPGAPVTFTNTSIPNCWGALTNSWNFGDGGSSGSSSPVYSYSTPGTYTVSLFATNAAGCLGSQTKVAYVHVFTPAAVGFSALTTTYCKKPATVAFTNGTTGSPTLSYTWEFGDGGTSPATNPSHTYSASGTYNVSLVVTDGNGCKDSLVQPSYISVGSLAAGFSATSPSCLNIPITFTNTSTAHVSSQWYFGDGGTSGMENPTYSYSVAGTYAVKLIVFDGTCYDSIIHTVNILALPTGGFTTVPSEPCPPPVSVTFNAGVPGGTTVAWLFGDGTTGTGPSFVKSYPTSVIDWVDMILTNASGCKDTIQKIDTIYNMFINPSADTAEGCAPRIVNFSMYAYSVVYNTFTSNYDFFTYPYATKGYDWDFGDGSPHKHTATPSHTFTATGVYTVTITDTTVNGCIGSATLTISVGKPAVPSFVLHPRHICSDRYVYDTSTSIGTIDKYVWSYGDGAVNTTYGLINFDSHKYTSPNIYTVKLDVYDHGCESIKSFALTDTVDSPSAVINFNYACIPNNEVDFRDFSYGDDAHLWQFGDGATSTISNPVHDYPTLSIFTVTLTTYNSRSGCRDTTRSNINLTPPIMQFVPTRLLVCRDALDTINSVVVGNGTPVSRYKWYDNGIAFDSTHNNPAHAFHVVGFHSIMLIVQDNRTCFDTLAKPNYILVAKPVDSFNFTPTSGCGPMPVTFTDVSTDVAYITILKYTWAFGDGATSTLFSPGASHIYTATGVYTVKEIVTDILGCMDTLTSHTKISVTKPIALFTSTATSVCMHTGVHFNNTSTGIVSSLWLFGDGDTSTTYSPVHAYTAAGVYTVRLVVTDSHGCTDTLTRPSLILVNPGPTASFYMSDSFAVCPPLNVHFTNTSIGASSYSWDFGDGHVLSATSPSEPYIASGIYTVKLAAIGPTGCTDTAIGHVTIFGYAGAFTYLPKSGCSPLYVHFSAKLSTVASIIWDYGDGTISGATTLDTISHIYSTPGAYVPKLTLKDSTGCSSFSVGLDTIKVDTITPAFTIIPNPGCINTGVSFHDSSYSYFSASTAWLWTFGGGATSTLSAPTHTFTASGTFPVGLQVTDASGCTGTIIKNVTINPTPPAITGVLTICKGTTSALTDGTAGGTWVSSNTSIATIGSSSGIFTGVSQGTATITYTVPLGCVVTAVVNIKPLPSIIMGATGICNGLTTTLTDSSAGGVWTSSITTVATIGSSSGHVISVALGTTTISYALPGGCATSAVITITNAPVAITGLTNICIGSTVPLTDAITGGNWTSGNTSVATIGPSSGLVYGAGLGTATITYSLGTGCVVNTSVTVLPVPGPIGGGSSVCAGLTFAVSDATSGGTWSSTNTSIAKIGTGTGLVTGISGGIDTIIYTLGTGCNAIKSVTINTSPPITGLTNICLGATTALTDAAPGGTWSSSNTSVATITTTGVVTGKTAGTTVIKYLLGTGCLNTTTVTVIAAPAPITGPGVVCVGYTVPLTDATTGGTWISGDSAVAKIGLSSGLASGMSSGTVIISYSIGTGCLSIASLIVNPVSGITGLTSVCVGQSARLADTTLGGTWSSSNTTVANIGSGSGIVTGVSAGAAIITYSLPTGCAVVYNFSVTALPTAITGTLHVCSGLTTILSDATPGGTWTSNNTAIATIGLGSGMVTGSIAGTATIIYFAGGCPATATLTVNPLPSTISGSPNMCLGASTLLSDGGGGTWLSSNTAVATIGSGSGIVNGAATGSSTITYTLPTGCITTTTVTVTPYPSGITGIAQVCVGSVTQLSDITPGGSWISSNSSIAIINSGGLVSGIFGGTSTISYSVSGCPATKIVQVNPLPNGIAGITNVCEGSVTALTDAGGGTWISSNTANATVGITSGVVAGVLSGTTIITYSLGTGCLVTTLVSVDPLPAAITGTTIMCTTLSTTLSDMTIGGNWTSSNTAVATIDPVFGIVAGLAAGSAIITYMLPTGCTAFTTVTVTRFPTTILGNPDVCLYGTITLSDAVTGGTWTSANTAVATVGLSSGIVSGVSLNTTVITYAIGTSCSISETVTVMPLPNIFSVTGGGTYCAGDAGVHVGLNGSQVGTNYFLYKGGIIATGPLAGTGVTLDFGLQTVAGKYTVRAANATTGCNQLMSGNVDIVVNPSVIPGISISTGSGDTVCSGTLVTFTGKGLRSGPLPVWKWNVNGTYVSLTNTYSYVPANGDIVTATMVSDTLCAVPVTVSKSDTITVSAPQLPTVEISTDPGDTICQGKTVTIATHTTFGGSSPVYAWMKNSVYVAGGPVFTYTANDGDIVYCNLTSNFPCVVTKTVASNSVVMVVDSPLVPHIEIVATPGANIGPGWSDTLTAVVSNAGLHPTYQWVLNGIPIKDATTPIYISNKFNNRDSVTCEVTSSGLCEMTTHNWVYMNVSNVGVKPVTPATSDITVLPNPNKGEFTIKGSMGTNNDVDVSVEITDLLGQVVYKNNVTAQNGNINTRILLGNSLANSMYILTLHSGAENRVFHIVLER